MKVKFFHFINLLIIGLLFIGSTNIGGVVITNSTLPVGIVTPSLIIGGTKGTDPSQFDQPDSVYVDSKGTIFAGDTSNLRVQVFAPNGTFLHEKTGFTPISSNTNNEVQGIGELSNGTIVVIEKAANLYFFDKFGTTPRAVIPLPVINSTESTRDTQGLAIDNRTDTIYVTDQPNNLVMVFDKNGVFKSQFSTGLYSTPENLVVDKKQNMIYVSLEGQRKIGYFAMNGTIIGSFGKEFATLNYEGITMDPRGNLLAVDEGPDSIAANKYSRVIIFNTTTYEPVAAIGGNSGSAPGKFLSPDGIAFDVLNNRFVVADQYNHRLQFFSYDSKLNLTTQGDVSVEFSKLSSKNFGWTLNGAIFGGKYELYKNGSSISSGNFMVGQRISPTFTDLVVDKTYNFTILASDANGNKVKAEALLHVTPDSVSTTKPSSPVSSGTATPLTLISMFAPILLIVIIQFKKFRIKE